MIFDNLIDFCNADKIISEYKMNVQLTTETCSQDGAGTSVTTAVETQVAITLPGKSFTELVRTLNTVSIEEDLRDSNSAVAEAYRHYQLLVSLAK